MKKGLFLISLLLYTIVFSSGVQRMLITATELNNISLSSSINSSVRINAKCLDYLKKPPRPENSLSHLLSGAQSVSVVFADNLEKVPLSKLLAKGQDGGIEIRGLNLQNGDLTWNDIVALVENSIIPPFKLEIINYTGRELTIFSKNNIQVGEQSGEAVNTYGGESQNDIWTNRELKKFRDLEYITEAQFNSYVKTMSSKLKFDKLDELTAEFEENNNLLVTGNLHTKETVERFDELYNEFLKNQEKIEESRKIFLKTYDLGIKGNSSNELIENYKNAAQISENIDWKNLKIRIKQDFDNRIYYLSYNNNYLKFIKGKRVKGILFKHTDNLSNNFDRLEDNLFYKKLNQKEFHILNFLSRTEDSETFVILNELFPNNHSDFLIKELSKLKSKIKKEGIKYVCCFGHYANNEIFAYDNGTKVSYKIDLLYKLAKEANVELFFIGCESSYVTKGGIGTTLNVNSIKMLKNLFESFSSSKSMGDLLNSLGAKGQYNYTYEVEENTDLIRIYVYNKTKSQQGINYHTFTDEKLILTLPKFYLPIYFSPQNDNDDKQSTSKNK